MIAPALRYFGLVFALGFVLGSIRTLWLAPAIGPTSAVLIELPMMLGASWIVARRIVRGSPIVTPQRALGIGVLAFLMLMAAEALLATTIGRQSVGQWARDLAATPGWIGLAGQIVFGLMPWLAAKLDAHRSNDMR